VNAIGFRPLRAAALAAALFSLAGMLHSAWIPLKAGLAQLLIEWSWRRELAGEPAPPWPWADTRAAAVLEAPRLRERLIVLAGQSGRNLAFGPVMLDATQPGGDTVISGHRDTHFRFLQDLVPGDRLALRDRRVARLYEVRTVDVVDSRRVDLLLEPGTDRLSLVTCYPFDAAAARGPLRYVVTAYPVRPRSPASG
jgi:sortase A